MQKRIAQAGMVLAMFGGGMAGAQAAGFDGGYFGVQAGGAVYDIDVSGEGTSVSGLGATGGSAGMLLGYGQLSAEGAYGAVEIDALVEDVETTIEIDGVGRDTLEARYSLGATARIGTLLADDVLLYGLLGYQQTEVRARSRIDGVGSMSDTDSLKGGRVGAGIEVDDGGGGWFVRGEASYTFYSSETYGDTRVAAGATRVQLGIGHRF